MDAAKENKRGKRVHSATSTKLAVLRAAFATTSIDLLRTELAAVQDLALFESLTTQLHTSWFRFLLRLCPVC
jgi:hypothetical protein